MSYKLDLPFLNNASSRGYSAFFWGMVLFYIYNHVPRKILLSISFSFIFSVAVCILHNSWLDDQGRIFTFILFPSILILALSIEKVFKSRFFSFLGGVSFEMYIWHVSLILLFISAKKIFGFEQIYTRTEMILFTAFVILISSLMYQFVEKPLSKYLRTKLCCCLS